MNPKSQQPRAKSPRQRRLPIPQLMTQSEVHHHLGKQIANDAIQAGWLAPCCEKPGTSTSAKRAKVLFATADILKVENRMLDGEYPQPNQA